MCLNVTIQRICRSVRIRSTLLPSVFVVRLYSYIVAFPNFIGKHSWRQNPLCLSPQFSVRQSRPTSAAQITRPSPNSTKCCRSIPSCWASSQRCCPLSCPSCHRAPSEPPCHDLDPAATESCDPACFVKPWLELPWVRKGATRAQQSQLINKPFGEVTVVSWRKGRLRTT